MSGAFSDVFTTRVLPAIRAGAILNIIIVTGAFQGVMAAQTPYGSRKVRFRKPEVWSEESPWMSVALPAIYLKNFAEARPSAMVSQFISILAKILCLE